MVCNMTAKNGLYLACDFLMCILSCLHGTIENRAVFSDYMGFSVSGFRTVSGFRLDFDRTRHHRRGIRTSVRGGVIPKNSRKKQKRLPSIPPNYSQKIKSDPFLPSICRFPVAYIYCQRYGCTPSPHLFTHSLRSFVHCVRGFPKSLEFLLTQVMGCGMMICGKVHELAIPFNWRFGCPRIAVFLFSKNPLTILSKRDNIQIDQ